MKNFVTKLFLAAWIGLGVVVILYGVSQPNPNLALAIVSTGLLILSTSGRVL